MPVLDEDDNLLWIAAVMPVAVTGFSLMIIYSICNHMYILNFFIICFKISIFSLFFTTFSHPYLVKYLKYIVIFIGHNLSSVDVPILFCLCVSLLVSLCLLFTLFPYCLVGFQQSMEELNELVHQFADNVKVK